MFFYLAQNLHNNCPCPSPTTTDCTIHRTQVLCSRMKTDNRSRIFKIRFPLWKQNKSAIKLHKAARPDKFSPHFGERRITKWVLLFPSRSDSSSSSWMKLLFHLRTKTGICFSFFVYKEYVWTPVSDYRVFSRPNLVYSQELKNERKKKIPPPS